MLKVNKKLTPYNHSSRYGNKIKYIVIHWVGAVSTARNNADYFFGGNRNASAHFFVDAISIWKSVRQRDAAWHCGGGYQDYGTSTGGGSLMNKCTNSNSIGIELCVIKKNGKRIVDPKAIENAIPLVQKLMKQYGIPASRVVRHFDVTGKICPNGYTTPDKWTALRKKLTTFPKPPAKPPVTPKPPVSPKPPTKPTTPKRKSNTTIAKEVLAGKWGNGKTRIAKLKKAGYDPKAIQKIVNKLM